MRRKLLSACHDCIRSNLWLWTCGIAIRLRENWQLKSIKFFLRLKSPGEKFQSADKASDIKNAVGGKLWCSCAEAAVARVHFMTSAPALLIPRLRALSHILLSPFLLCLRSPETRSICHHWTNKSTFTDKSLIILNSRVEFNDQSAALLIYYYYHCFGWCAQRADCEHTEGDCMHLGSCFILIALPLYCSSIERSPEFAVIRNCREIVS